MRSEYMLHLLQSDKRKMDADEVLFKTC
jgi:hypothetical protein